jgi:succinate-acetate transporter protein
VGVALPLVLGLARGCGGREGEPVSTSTRTRPAVGNGHVPRLREFSPAANDVGQDDAVAPSVLGLYGLFTATVLYGSTLAGWWGGSGSPILIFPFVVVLGGVVQLLAALWAARAADPLGAALHGVWGAFWLGFGLYQLLVTTRRLPVPVPGRGSGFDFGMWFVPLTAVTAALALAAVATSLGLAAVLTSLTGASLFAVLGFTGTDQWALTASGWLFVVAAAGAWYLASALLLESQRGRPVLPTGRRRVT